MKRSQLKALIRETVEEVLAISPLGVADEVQQLNEKSPPDFPKALHDKLLKQYKGEEDKAYATMWKIFYAKKKGHKKIDEMWTAWENKGMTEQAGGTITVKANVQNNVYPMTSEEIEAAVKKYGVQIKFLGDAAFGTSTSDSYSFTLTGPSGQVDALVDKLSEDNGIEFQDATLKEHDETDLSNPEEKREVELANQIKKLAAELLSMHGAEGEESEKSEDGTSEETSATK